MIHDSRREIGRPIWKRLQEENQGGIQEMEEIITVVWNTICDVLIALHLAVEVKYDVD